MCHLISEFSFNLVPRSYVIDRWSREQGIWERYWFTFNVVLIFLVPVNNYKIVSQ